ncbi:hypothetical protein LLB_0222 [Legionella longbeachae D-4968]|nr:hypothetical protein LLB_0222 [Legionella longbeachae D-4968]
MSSCNQLFGKDSVVPPVPDFLYLTTLTPGRFHDFYLSNKFV